MNLNGFNQANVGLYIQRIEARENSMMRLKGGGGGGLKVLVAKRVTA